MKSADASVKDAPYDAATGVACGRDPATHVELCSGISSCPNLLVDPDALFGCGFLPTGMELACLCDDRLCTLGKPKSCMEAKAMIESTNVLDVCAQVAEGTCKLAK